MAALWAMALAVALVVTPAPDSGAAPPDRPSHSDRVNNPDGCAACHSGRGLSRTPLLKDQPVDLCLKCHGSLGRGRGRAQADVETALNKVSFHPVLETGQYHSVAETLPASSASEVRHVHCSDCHSVHLSTPGNPLKGKRGYAPGQMRGPFGGPPRGSLTPEVTLDYELCYLCHADSVNLPADSRNVAYEFDATNASFHPVETDGRNKRVPSLVPGLNETSTIGCGACHGNSDQLGARGPHGSDYAPLLIEQYITSDGPESAKAYALCYSCHDRASILGNESFAEHSRHIVMASTSCATCHASHGSRDNANLILFERTVVMAANATGGQPFYYPGVYGKPKCSLNCHGVEHNNTDVNGNPWQW